MTCYGLIKSIINSPEHNGYDMDRDDAIKLIAIAYFMGRESQAREMGDKAKEIFKAQRERAEECRYNKMAMAVQGNIDWIYSPDYAEDMTGLFGSDETKLTIEDLKKAIKED